MRPFAGETERALAYGVREYVAGISGERIVAAEREGRIPPDVIADLGRLGVLSLTVPEADGGLGASSVAFALVLEELAAAWPSLAVGVSVNCGIVAGSITRLGTEAQRRRWLPVVMGGEGLAGFCLTEPASGSDAAALRTTATPADGGWVLNGSKLFVTSAKYAKLLIVLARVSSATADRPHAGITAFLVPTDAPGLTVNASEKKMGLLASDTSGVSFDGARVGADAVLGEVGQGFGPVALAGLDAGRIGIGAQAVGIARGALERATQYARGRRQFGKAIAEFQAIRFMLAGARTELEAARLLVHRAADRKDRGEPFSREASEAKLYASEMAGRATHIAVQVMGGYGYIREFAVERHARDARATTIYEGTSEVQRLVIARSLLREAA